jgi:hypothetical protein
MSPAELAKVASWVAGPGYYRITDVPKEYEAASVHLDDGRPVR